jgi:hypothetical protein
LLPGRSVDNFRDPLLTSWVVDSVGAFTCLLGGVRMMLVVILLTGRSVDSVGEFLLLTRRSVTTIIYCELKFHLLR